VVPPKCVIFDCDGVLVDSETLSSEVLLSMVAACGFSIPVDDVVKKLAGLSFRDCLTFFEDLNGKRLPENFEHLYRQRTYETFRLRLKAIDGVSELLEQSKIPRCVASSGPREKIELNLTITGLRKYFADHIFSCYDIGKWKPDPAIYLHAAERMGFLPQECLVIEDTAVGAQAAQRGGFPVWVYAAHHYHDLAGLRGVTTFQTMSQLREFIV
jgi:HAD superfamily hydrolase (TIGR01509 family)